MRIEEDDFSKIDYPQLYRQDTGPRHRLSKLVKFVLSLSLTFFIILILIGVSVKFAIGPIMKNIDRLPGDFPEELAFYQLDRAQIKIQDENSREKIIKVIQKLPNWAIEPLLQKISPDLQKEFQQTFGNKAAAGSLDAQELKNFLSDSKLQGVKNISLSWINLGKTKEELTAYYKDALKNSGFEFEENLADYEINLGFWKDGVFGNMSLRDSKEGLYKSDVDVTVNYFNQ